MADDQFEQARGVELLAQDTKTYRVRVDSAGRIVLPSPLRTGMSVSSGDELLIRKELGGLRLETFSQALEAAQDFFVRHFATARRTDESARSAYVASPKETDA